MHADDEKLLRLSKEIIIKFIELGRVSPNNFDENFKNIFWTLKKTLVDARAPELSEMGTDTKDAYGGESDHKA